MAGNRAVDGSSFFVDIPENSTSVVQLDSTFNSLEESTEVAINVADTSTREVARLPTSNREVDGSPLPVAISENSKSAVQPDSPCISQVDWKVAMEVLQQIANDNGKLVKDRNGRFRIEYNDNINEYHKRIKRVNIISDGYNCEYREHIRQLLESITIQKNRLYPFTVIRNNNEHKLITSESNNYRAGIEYKIIAPNKDTPLYKHLEENSAVRLVKDIVTGFTHICKTNLMSNFKCEEVEAMLCLHKVAPELFVVNRDGEYVILHMELIEGKRLDIVANHILNEHMWPLILHIFSDILYAINILMSKDLSHCDIHSKNIIIEVQEGKFRTHLIDYGDACGYTINNLIKDMRSLVASLLALFTRNDFDAYKNNPDTWIKDNPEIRSRYPNMFNIIEGGLNIKNGESLKQFINYVEALIVEERKNTDFNNRLEEIAKLLKEETQPSVCT